MTLYFRQSEIKKFKRCPRSWWLSYKIDGMGYQIPRDDKPQSGQRDVGTLVHEGLAYYYQTGLDPVEHLDSIAAGDAEMYGKASPEWEKVYLLARTMLAGYMQWLEAEGVDQGEDVLGVEVPIEVPVGNIRGEDVVLTAQLDLIVRRQLTGEIIVRDHKTVQSLDQVGMQLQVDDQGLNYCTLVKGGLRYDAHIFQHNMLRKVLRSKTATPPFYGRHEVRYTSEQLDNAWLHTMVTVDRMIEALQRPEKLHHFGMIPNPTKDCTWDCDFLAVCPMMDDGSDWRGALTESGLYIRREPNEVTDLSSSR